MSQSSLVSFIIIKIKTKLLNLALQKCVLVLAYKTSPLAYILHSNPIKLFVITENCQPFLIPQCPLIYGMASLSPIPTHPLRLLKHHPLLEGFSDSCFTKQLVSFLCSPQKLAFTFIISFLSSVFIFRL